MRTPPKQAEAAIRPIKAPTLVIWGQRDRYLGQELAEPDATTCPASTASSVCPTPRTGCIHDEAERVSHLLTGFFAPALAK